MVGRLYAITREREEWEKRDPWTPEDPAVDAKLAALKDEYWSTYKALRKLQGERIPGEGEE
jgi:hypothetical protein